MTQRWLFWTGGKSKGATSGHGEERGEHEGNREEGNHEEEADEDEGSDESWGKEAGEIYPDCHVMFFFLLRCRLILIWISTGYDKKFVIIDSNPPST